MDKQTLSNYGWIVICVLVLAVMIALATPFGTFVSDAVKSTTQGLFDVNQNALNSTGLINIDGQEFDSCLHEYEVTRTTANCTTAGTTTHTCKLCGKSYSEETPAGHKITNGACENCDITLYTITIDGVEYYTESYSVKFKDWLNSEYNTDNYVLVKVYLTRDGVTYGPSSLIVNSDKNKYLYYYAENYGTFVPCETTNVGYHFSWQLGNLSETGYTIIEE